MEQIIEYQKTYQEYKAELDAELSRTAEGFVRIGYLLKVARDTDVLKESDYETVTDFAKAEYGIDKTQVSRFIHINDKFAEGGYADRLEERYRGFGYAKLTLMLQLPEEINEELTPEYSKAEIQAIKEEVEAEQQISDIEVMLEQEPDTTAAVEDDLVKTIKQLGQDDPQLFAAIYQAFWQHHWSIPDLQELMAPAGQKLYSIRIPGIGRKELILKDKDNGNDAVLINLRTAEKKRYTWYDLMYAWETITAAGPETEYKAAWEALYMASWPIPEKVAPAQQSREEKKPAPRKESKVQKAKKPEPPKPVKTERKSAETEQISAEMVQLAEETRQEEQAQGTEKPENTESEVVFKPGMRVINRTTGEMGTLRNAYMQGEWVVDYDGYAGPRFVSEEDLIPEDAATGRDQGPTFYPGQRIRRIKDGVKGTIVGKNTEMDAWDIRYDGHTVNMLIFDSEVKDFETIEWEDPQPKPQEPAEPQNTEDDQPETPLPGQITVREIIGEDESETESISESFDPTAEWKKASTLLTRHLKTLEKGNIDLADTPTAVLQDMRNHMINMAAMMEKELLRRGKEF